jgi:hypothetical protein
MPHHKKSQVALATFKRLLMWDRPATGQLACTNAHVTHVHVQMKLGTHLNDASILQSDQWVMEQLGGNPLGIPLLPDSEDSPKDPRTFMKSQSLLGEAKDYYDLGPMPGGYDVVSTS